MAGQSEILKEYLVGLGFKIDEPSNKKAERSVEGFDKRVKGLSKSMAAVAIGAQVMATEFAFRMERLFYASKLAESSAANLSAIDFGGKQVGVQNMTANVQNMARALRANPGLEGFLNSMGVKVTGRDMSDVMTDFVEATTRFPSYIANQQAAMFGIGPDDLLLMQQGLKEMKAAMQLRKDAALQLGVDTDKAVEAGKEYAQSMREILMLVGLFRDALTIQMLGPMREIAAVTKLVLQDWIEIVNAPAKLKAADDAMKGVIPGPGAAPAPGGSSAPAAAPYTPEELQRLNSPLGQMFPGYAKDMVDRRRRGGKLTKEEGEDIYGGGSGGWPDWMLSVGGVLKDFWDWNYDKGTDAKPGAPAPAPAGRAAQQPAGTAKTLMQQLEQRYKLSPGLLDRVWAKESGRGKNLLSPKGAKGHFQFMDGTAQQYGLKDPNNFGQAADAAARKYADLVAKYSSESMAAAAYNWGDKGMDALVKKAKDQGLAGAELEQYVLGRVPKETRDYVNSVAPSAAGAVTVNQDIKVDISTQSDARSTGAAVEQTIRNINADTVRQFTPRVR